MSARRGARSGRQPRVLAPGRRRLVVFIFSLSSLVLLNSVYNHDAELFPAPTQGSSEKPPHRTEAGPRGKAAPLCLRWSVQVLFETQFSEPPSPGVHMNSEEGAVGVTLNAIPSILLG